MCRFVHGRPDDGPDMMFFHFTTLRWSRDLYYIVVKDEMLDLNEKACLTLLRLNMIFIH